ncbi:dihydropteroate synthase [Sandaracinobacter sp. RS1-74]|uniref:dihydropteroate synthase n=1 Tax=Sandaracinobacteroides sayramensis TaxID=2913411 RepID=UPI001EDA982F|nr:dihydropteroate synthase [Sandaracinobacteroides sayramensis]MCG2841722.1 dihydropteroate synthase [Sandaracinobacteroides sayramensis]
MRPKLMGILNVTPDSFSDGGRHASLQQAIAAGLRLAEAGADIIDVGGESTRPGAAEVPLEEEIRRTAPVVEALARQGLRVSIDTMKAGVMRAALDAGATMLNDVSALQADPQSLPLAAASGAQVVLMHMPGNPRTMQGLAEYRDVVAEVQAALAARIAAAEAAGIPRARLIADPGIGFGKDMAQNLALMRALEAFHALGVPLLLGASRKSLIPAVAGPAAPSERLPGSLALALRGAEAKVAWLRVHDVAETRQALALWEAIRP